MAKPKAPPKEKAKVEAPKSLDEAIGKGLSGLDQKEKDFAQHPKFAKFKKEEQ